MLVRNAAPFASMRRGAFMASSSHGCNVNHVLFGAYRAARNVLPRRIVVAGMNTRSGTLPVSALLPVGATKTAAASVVAVLFPAPEASATSATSAGVAPLALVGPLSGISCGVASAGTAVCVVTHPAVEVPPPRSGAPSSTVLAVPATTAEVTLPRTACGSTTRRCCARRDSGRESPRAAIAATGIGGAGAFDGGDVAGSSGVPVLWALNADATRSGLLLNMKPSFIIVSPLKLLGAVTKAVVGGGNIPNTGTPPFSSFPRPLVALPLSRIAGVVATPPLLRPHTRTDVRRMTPCTRRHCSHNQTHPQSKNVPMLINATAA